MTRAMLHVAFDGLDLTSACAAAPALAMHPMHFLYAIFHACVAPIAGHDGYVSSCKFLEGDSGE